MEEWFEGDGFRLKWPYPIQAVRSLRVEQKFNEHTRCTLTVAMTDEQAERCMIGAGFEDSLLICKPGNPQEEHWFAGGISNLEMTMEDGIPSVTVEALSRSYEMDVRRKSRSYQNKQTTYTQVIKGLTEGYRKGDAQNEATEPGAVLGELVVQYQETDWQFMKRLASRLGTVILPDTTMDAARIYFGVPDFSWGKDLKATQYSMEQNQESYLRYREQAAENGAKIPSEADWISYRARSNQYFRVGENVGFKRQIWVIAGSVITYDKGTIQYEYVLVKRQALRRKSRLNKAIQGVALEGRVLKRANNMVKVHLDIDKEHDESGNWWFPYSPEGNNIFHCMPDEGARIKVYFPNGMEKQAIAINSVRGGSEEMKTRTVFQKPTTKVFHMPGDAKMELGDDGVLFEKNTVSLKLDGENIRLSAEENIVLIAVNTVELTKTESASKLESIRMKAKSVITHMTNKEQFVEIAGNRVLIQNKKVNFEKVDMNILDMLTDEELEETYIEYLLENGAMLEAYGEALTNNEIVYDDYDAYKNFGKETKKVDLSRETVRKKLTEKIQSDPDSKNTVRNALKGLKEAEAQSYYLKTNRPPATDGKGEERTNDEIKQAHQEYEAAYKNYNMMKRVQYDLKKEAEGQPSFMLAEKAPPKQQFPGILDVTKVVEEEQSPEYEALKDEMRKKMNGETAEKLTPLAQAMNALGQGLENSDFWLENVIPKKPDYFSKRDETVTYLSRLNFLNTVTVPQKQAAALGILFGVVAIVLALPTMGSSLYIAAIGAAEIAVGAMQIKISSDKLRDLNAGNNYSSPKVFGLDQEAVNTADIVVSLVGLSVLFKPNLKAADTFKDSQRLAALKETAGNKYANFKNTMKDANINLNPRNYNLEWEKAPALNTGYGSVGRGFGRFRLDRVADEPFIQFSSSSGGGGAFDVANIDLNKIGTGAVGNFQNIKDLNDFITRIPANAKQIPWRQVPGGAKDGVKFRWVDGTGKTWDVRAHSIDPTAPPGSNAAKGWIYRVEVKQVNPKWKWTMDSSGNFHKENVLRESSPYYNESIANETHIPFTP